MGTLKLWLTDHGKRLARVRLLDSSCLVSWSKLLTVRLSLAVILASLAVAECSILDGTVLLDAPGRGLLQHWGILAIFATAPLLIVLTYVVMRDFQSILSDLDAFTLGPRIPSRLENMAALHLRSIRLQTETRYLLWLGMIIGFFCSLINIKQTIFPDSTYANDVFDAYPHMLGFLSFKIYLTVLWTFFYPVAFFIALHATFSMIAILRLMSRKRIFDINFFHADNCGGMSAFGDLNLRIMLIHGLVLVVVIAIRITHQGTYATIMVSLFFSALLFLAQSLGAVYYVHSFVRLKKRELLSRLNSVLDGEIRRAVEQHSFPYGLLVARNHIVKINTFPYTRQASFLVNALRLGPILVGALNFLRTAGN